MLTFTEKGPVNTEKTLDLAIRKAKELNCPLVVATTSGEAALKAVELSQKLAYSGQIIAVTHAYGFKIANEIELSEENRQQLEAAHVKIITAAHALSAGERSFGSGFFPLEIIANTLRMFSQGVKVCVEIAAMACDNGAIKENAICVIAAGSAHGLDTACIITPAVSARILKTCINEILCMPFER